MLLEFKASNYKSFKDEFTLSLVPAPKQKDLDYSVMKTGNGKNQYKALCSAVIYGPNASGKTNVIGAIDTFKQIVLRGNIRNDETGNNPNKAAGMLELIPNNTLSLPAPVEFSATFIEDGYRIKYAFSADFGKFLSSGHKRKIISEKLFINETLIFQRYEELVIGAVFKFHNLLVNAYEQNADSAAELAKSSLNDEELFLMNGFKTMFSSEIVALITNWLDTKLTVIYSSNTVHLSPTFSGMKEKSVIMPEAYAAALKCFGVNSSSLYYVKERENEEAKLYSIFHNNDKAIPAETFESYGTIRFINLFPLIINAMIDGGTLIVDEFDASIHPMALMSIVNSFHNDDINVNHAQLIFNTHNPIFLNANLFRRDEVKFVERDEESHGSTLYSLADFGTAGKKGVRKNEDYMKNYFIDRYGAIKDVDFSHVFETLTQESGV